MYGNNGLAYNTAVDYTGTLYGSANMSTFFFFFFSCLLVCVCILCFFLLYDCPVALVLFYFFQELHDLRGVYEDFRAASRERVGALSERAASALMRERSRAVLRATVWQWRAITLEVTIKCRNEIIVVASNIYV